MDEIKSGIYFLVRNKKVVYIGKAKNLSNRTRAHIKDIEKKFDTIILCKVKNKTNMEILEKILISEYKPEYNIDSKYDENSSIYLDRDPIRYFDDVEIKKIENGCQSRIVTNHYEGYNQKGLVNEMRIKKEIVVNYDDSAILRAIES